MTKTTMRDNAEMVRNLVNGFIENECKGITHEYEAAMWKILDVNTKLLCERYEKKVKDAEAK